MIYSCSNPDNESSNFETFTVKISENYFLDLPGYKESGEFFLTDSEGLLLARSTIINGETISLEIEEKAILSGINFVFLEKITLDDREIYSFSSFDQVNLNFIEFLDGNENRTSINGEANILIANTNGQLEDLQISHSGSTSIMNSNTNFSISLNSEPQPFYASFYNPSEDQYKYILKEEVFNEESDTVSYASLPVISNPTTITFPENVSAHIRVRGQLADTLFLRAYDKTFFNNESSTNVWYPKNVFEQYEQYFNVLTNEYQIISSTISNEITTQLDDPNFTATTMNENISNFEIITSGDYNNYDILFLLQDTLNNFDIHWRFFGEKKQNIQLSLPDIGLKSLVGDENLDLLDFKLTSISLDKIDIIQNTESHIYYRLDKERYSNENINLTRVIW